jgi:hypothetical protein
LLYPKPLLLSSAFFLKKKAPFAESQRARELWSRFRGHQDDAAKFRLSHADRTDCYLVGVFTVISPLHTEIAFVCLKINQGVALV